MSDETADMEFERPDSVLAGEYVLHLLGPAERADADDRLAVDGGFRAEVARWHEDFAAFTDEIDPVTPPYQVRKRLENWLKAEGDRPAPAASPERGTRSGGIARWLGGALGGLVVAAAAMVFLAVVLPQVEPPYSGPFYAADLSGEGSDLVVRARYDPRDAGLSLSRQQGGAPEGRVLQLWLIAEGLDAPASLGVLPEAAETRVTVPDDLAPLVTGGTLAISEEPPGGSPTGVPTGEVLAAGGVTDA